LCIIRNTFAQYAKINSRQHGSLISLRKGGVFHRIQTHEKPVFQVFEPEDIDHCFC
jgi:hypothetical protein